MDSAHALVYKLFEIHRMPLSLDEIIKELADKGVSKEDILTMEQNKYLQLYDDHGVRYYWTSKACVHQDFVYNCLNSVMFALKSQLKMDTTKLREVEVEKDGLQRKRMQLAQEKECMEVKNSVDPIELMDITLDDVNVERNKLHKDFNEIRDLADRLIGYLAECQDCSVSRIYSELDLHEN